MSDKITEINLETGLPTVEMAIIKLKNELMTQKKRGIKAVIVIHGYGSSGTGGKIKPAVLKCLGEDSMRGLVRMYVGGEQWSWRKKELLSLCKGLEAYERRIVANEGITIVLLK
jgi:hypothetical protein